MKRIAYLIINRNGVKAVRKTKPALDWDEIVCKILLNIPDELFKRPQPEIIVNTKELIEQQTGAKIDFKIMPIEEKKEKNE